MNFIETIIKTILVNVLKVFLEANSNSFIQSNKFVCAVSNLHIQTHERCQFQSFTTFQITFATKKSIIYLDSINEICQYFCNQSAYILKSFNDEGLHWIQLVEQIKEE